MNYSLIIIYILFFGGGLFLIVSAFLQYTKANKAAAEWSTVQGVVQDSRIINPSCPIQLRNFIDPISTQNNISVPGQRTEFQQ